MRRRELLTPHRTPVAVHALAVVVPGLGHDRAEPLRQMRFLFRRGAWVEQLVLHLDPCEQEAVAQVLPQVAQGAVDGVGVGRRVVHRWGRGCELACIM